MFQKKYEKNFKHFLAIFLTDFRKKLFCQIFHGFYTFQRGVFLEKIGSQKWPKFAKKGMLTYTDQISKIKTFPRIPYGSGIRENALAEVFFSVFEGSFFLRIEVAFTSQKLRSLALTV